MSSYITLHTKNEEIFINLTTTHHPNGTYPVLEFGDNITLFPSLDQLKELHLKLGEFLHDNEN